MEAHSEATVEALDKHTDNIDCESSSSSSSSDDNDDHDDDDDDDDDGDDTYQGEEYEYEASNISIGLLLTS